MNTEKTYGMQIVISTSQRFVAQYRNHRISIAGLGDNTSKYDYDIRDAKHMCVREEIRVFDDISKCIEYCKTVVDKLCDGMTVDIEDHTQVNKSFDMILEDLDFHLQIDYDDVDHVETDAVVQYLKTIIEANWERKDFIKHFKAELTKYWRKKPRRT